MAWTTGLTSIGIDTSVSSGASVVGSGTANTKGSWVQLTASTPSDSWGFIFQIEYRTSNILVDDYLIDIGIGAAGAETVIVANVQASAVSNRGGIATVLMPLAIASGTRVAVRCQNSSTSTADILGISMVLLGKSTQLGSSSCETYGAATADSGGTSIDPGGTSNTKGAYTQLTATTTADINWLVIALGTQDSQKATSMNWLIDIAKGAAGAETVVIPDWSTGLSSGGNGNALPRFLSVPVPTIASGSRLAARAACSINGTPTRLLDLVVYGFNVPQITGGSSLVAPLVNGGLVQ